MVEMKINKRAERRDWGGGARDDPLSRMLGEATCAEAEDQHRHLERNRRPSVDPRVLRRPVSWPLPASLALQNTRCGEEGRVTCSEWALDGEHPGGPRA